MFGAQPPSELPHPQPILVPKTMRKAVSHMGSRPTPTRTCVSKHCMYICVLKPEAMEKFHVLSCESPVGVQPQCPDVERC